MAPWGGKFSNADGSCLSWASRICRLLRKRKMAKVQPTRANRLKMPKTIPITELVLSEVPDWLDSGPGLNVVVDAAVVGITVRRNK